MNGHIYQIFFIENLVTKTDFYYRFKLIFRIDSFGDWANCLFHHFLLSFLEVHKALYFLGLQYRGIFLNKINFFCYNLYVEFYTFFFGML